MLQLIAALAQPVVTSCVLSIILQIYVIVTFICLCETQLMCYTRVLAYVDDAQYWYVPTPVAARFHDDEVSVTESAYNLIRIAFVCVNIADVQKFVWGHEV